MDSSQTATDDRPTCPECGHENIPGASFCGRCGASLKGGERVDPPLDDAQATSVYEPVRPADVSPWAPPGTIDVAPADSASQTGALPAREPWSPPVAPASTAADLPPAARHRESPRGLVLGIIAALLIAIVIGVYLYAAWLSDGARDTIDGLLPWVS